MEIILFHWDVIGPILSLFACNNDLTAMLQRTGKMMDFGLNYMKTLVLIGPVHLK